MKTKIKFIPFQYFEDEESFIGWEVFIDDNFFSQFDDLGAAMSSLLEEYGKTAEVEIMSFNPFKE